MIHPLNKRYFNPYKNDEFIWYEEERCFRHTRYENFYCLGDRFLTKPDWWLGNILDYKIIENETFKARKEAFEWLHGAQHQEYGCRLWCSES